ncbi:MAG TPA: DUF4197 domain-containing protein [Terriglobia bacterium]|nr:DUF4197 domain-containing protein [Terriglobia bacterium]
MKPPQSGPLIFLSRPKRHLKFPALLVGWAVFLTHAPAPCWAGGQLDSILNRLKGGNKAGLGESKIASGLKEALRVGTENTVKSTGRKDGYFANAAIKILLPQKLRLMEKGLRLMGKGPQVDEFVLSMNRAAEQAAPLAQPIFLDALKQMTFDDARKILAGNNTAATDYFKQKTTGQLTTAFTPVVKKSMENVGVTKKYSRLMGVASDLPLGKPGTLDIDRYVVSKSLDGLFYVLGQEEAKIRKNPAAQVTPLLKQVFGK